MPTRTVTFLAHDDSRRTWAVPKRGSPYLLIQAVDRVAREGDAGLALVGLTLTETEIVSEIVAWLEEHRKARVSA